ncbi:hypothetical protein [Pseudomonas panipatensis]|uniref:hypothetical protein n=1 Tax=Pseudomonas panipatensis TaxID=428992 RepID=UPI0035B20CBF
MDIRIEKFDGDPPTWKVFLGTFFIVCHSEEEAVTCREAARHYAAVNPGIDCRLPQPCTPAHCFTRDGLSAVAHEALAEDRALLLGGDGDAG